MPRTFRSKTLAGGALAAAKRAAKTPQLQTCLLRTLYCLPWTETPVTLFCEGGRFDPQSYGRRLAELKSDLREALTEVQAHEKEIAGPAKEGARLALEQLEVGLKDMLQQVEQKTRKRKHKVQQRAQSR